MSKPVVLCIGTASVSGDSLGPIVGDILVKDYNIDAYVYGRSHRPVNGNNYAKYIQHIERYHKCSLIIAVDACVGIKEEIGKIKLKRGGIVAGGALSKGYQRVGDIGILGIVAQKQQDNLSALMQVPLLFVEEMGKVIAKRIYAMLANF